MVMAALASTFRVQLQPFQLEGYFMALSHLDDERFAAAAKRAMATCKHMPMPTELIEIAGDDRMHRETKKILAELEEAERRMKEDPRVKRLLELRADGINLEAAMAKVDEEMP